MGKIVRIKDQNNVDVFPLTHERGVRDSSGVTLETKLAQLVGSADIDIIEELTQTEYDALATKDARTMYIVSDSTIPSDHVGIASFAQTTTSNVDGGTNVWTVTLTNGQTFTLQVKNGNQGNSGYSGAAGELEVVNNLTDGGATAALSAEMGKTLEGEISQLGLEVDGKTTDYVDKTTDMGTPVNGSYSSTNHEYNSSTIRLLYKTPLGSELPEGISKIKIKVGNGFGWAAQVWSKVYDSTVMPISAPDQYLLFNSSAWTYGEGFLELPSGAKSFAITVRKSDNTTISTDTNVSLEVYYGTELQTKINGLADEINTLSTRQDDVEETLDEVLIPEYSSNDITSQLGSLANAAYNSSLESYRDAPARVATLQTLTSDLLSGKAKIRVKTNSDYGWAVQVWSKTFSNVSTLPFTVASSYLLFNSSSWTYGEGEVDLSSLTGAKSFCIVVRNQAGTSISTSAAVFAKVELLSDSGYKPIQDTVDEINEQIDTLPILKASLSYEGAKIDMSERQYDRTILMQLKYSDYTNITSTSMTKQAIAVHGDYMVRTFKEGGLAIYNLKTKTFIRDIILPLDSSILEDFHGSNVSFGVEYPSGNTEFPALYVCETTGGKRCFVFSLKLDGTCTLLQTLSFGGTWGNGTTDWRDFIVDKQNGVGWWIGYDSYVSGTGANYTIYKKVPLKALSVSSYAYQDSDVEDSFTNSAIKVIQGAFILNNHLYVGDYRIYVANLDLTTKTEVGHINLYGFCLEIEGICNYNGYMLADLVHTRGETTTPLYQFNFVK